MAARLEELEGRLRRLEAERELRSEQRRPDESVTGPTGPAEPAEPADLAEPSTPIKGESDDPF